MCVKQRSAARTGGRWSIRCCVVLLARELLGGCIDGLNIAARGGRQTFTLPLLLQLFVLSRFLSRPPFRIALFLRWCCRFSIFMRLVGFVSFHCRVHRGGAVSSMRKFLLPRQRYFKQNDSLKRKEKTQMNVLSSKRQTSAGFPGTRRCFAADER